MQLLEWITEGECGISSKTMWSAIVGGVKSGKMGFKYDVPADPDDFRRCYLFYRQCYLTDRQLNKVIEVFPWWKPFIDNWFKLCALWLEESPSGRCPKLYKFIQQLEEESRILAGWIKTSETSWEFEND